MDRQLSGLVVVELSTYAAAPAAGRLLVDMGARVIKVEPPMGDPFRQYGLSIGLPCHEDENPCFQLENAGKESICIDLKSDEGKETFFKLLNKADIFFTNNRLSALKKLGIDYDSIKDRFPNLIYGHLSGYGFKGEDANLPGFDSTAFWARGGGQVDLAYKGKGPLGTPYAVGDHTASLALAAGLLGALYRKMKSGIGDYVLVSLYGVSVFVNALCLIPSQAGYCEEIFPQDERYPVSPVQTTYLCADDAGVTLTFLDHRKHWAKFCKEVINCPELAEDERYADIKNIRRPENNRYMTGFLTGIFRQNTAQHWIDLLNKADLPCGKVQHFRDVIHDELAWDNGYLSDYVFPNGRHAVIANTPIYYGDYSARNLAPAPAHGEHTEAILKELEMGEK